jgi:peptide/nickel transport system substrate-binding protein
MDAEYLRRMIDRVTDGRLSRRCFIRRMAADGLTAPMATQLLAIGGVAMAEPATTYKPTKRGDGGALKVLWWQAPPLRNPHFATGTKDQEGSSMFYEPLAGWDGDGNLRPMLAAEIPSVIMAVSPLTANRLPRARIVAGRISRPRDRSPARRRDG